MPRFALTAALFAALAAPALAADGSGPADRIVIKVMPGRHPAGAAVRGFDVDRSQPHQVEAVRHGTLRTAPQMDSEAAGQIAPGEKVLETGEVAGGQWLELERNGRRSYASVAVFGVQPGGPPHSGDASAPPAPEAPAVAGEQAVQGVLDRLEILKPPPAAPVHVPAQDGER
jgi:hypothetical protein